MAAGRGPCYAPGVLNLPYNLQWPELVVLASVVVLILAPRGLLDMARALQRLALATARLLRPARAHDDARSHDEI